MLYASFEQAEIFKHLWGEQYQMERIVRMKHSGKNLTVTIAVIGSSILAIILVVGTLWLGHHARQDTEAAVRSVSLLYLGKR